MAYAITIHRSQGLTILVAKTEIGYREFATGLAYVLLSKVRKLSDLIFMGFPSKKRFNSIALSNATQLKMKSLRYFTDKSLVR